MFQLAQHPGESHLSVAGLEAVTIRYGLAVAHVHCAQPMGARNGQFNFLVRSL